MNKLKNVTVKTEWRDVKIKEYMYLVELLTTDSENKEFKILSTLTDLDLEDIYKLKMNQIDKLLYKVEFIHDEPEPIHKDIYEINGVTYKPSYQIGEYEAGRFIDIMHLTENEDKILDNIHYIIACILNPVKIRRFRANVEYKYNEIPIKETAENLYNHMNICEAMSILIFFWILYGDFSKNTGNSLKQETVGEISQNIKNQTIGHG